MQLGIQDANIGANWYPGYQHVQVGTTWYPQTTSPVIETRHKDPPKMKSETVLTF